MAFNAESVDFDAFHPVTADYGPRDIHAVAAMVTSHNVGQWAVEFEKDLINGGAGGPSFEFVAEREGEEPITLTVKAGVWIVKIWQELHIFEDGMFQKTFSVPKEQLRAVRKAFRDKELELEREFQEEIKEERAAADREMEERFERVQETGDWSELSDGEKYILKIRLREDEEIQELIAAARERKAKEAVKPQVGPDYHAGSLFKSEGQDPSFYEKDTATIRAEQEERKNADLSENLNREVEELTESEKTQFIPQVSIPIGLETMEGWKRPIYPEGDKPDGGN